MLTPGDRLTTFRIDGDVMVGLGICFDIYFDEYSRALRKAGCDMIVYPNAFNTSIGPMHWDLLNRARAADNQVYTVSISPARIDGAEYEAWGYSMVSDPWGRVLKQAGVREETLYQVVGEWNAVVYHTRCVTDWLGLFCRFECDSRIPSADSALGQAARGRLRTVRHG